MGSTAWLMSEINLLRYADANRPFRCPQAWRKQQAYACTVSLQSTIKVLALLSLSPWAFPSRRSLSRLHPPKRILTARPQWSRKHASGHLSAPGHNSIRLPVDFHSSPVIWFRRRQSPLSSLACRLGRRQRLRLLLAGGSGVIICGCEDTLAVIVASFEDGAGPFSQETLCGAFDGELWLLGFGVEEDYFADTAGYQAFFVDRQSC